MKKVWWYGYGQEFVLQMEGFLDMMFAPSWGKRMAGGLRSAKAYLRKSWL